MTDEESEGSLVPFGVIGSQTPMLLLFFIVLFFNTFYGVIGVGGLINSYIISYHPMRAKGNERYGS